MEWFFITLFALLVLSLLFSKVADLPGLSSEFFYQRKPNLFSAAESSFLKMLDMAVRDKYRVFGKVRIADVLTPQKGLNRKDWFSAFGRISSKHFDYVLCDIQTLKIVAVVELDDKSHNSDKAIKRDSFVNSICEISGLPLIRFKAARTYKLQEMKIKILAVTESQQPEINLEDSGRVEPVFKAP